MVFKNVGAILIQLKKTNNALFGWPRACNLTKPDSFNLNRQTNELLISEIMVENCKFW